MNYPGGSEADIVAGLKVGSPEAFRSLYQAHGAAILTYLFRLTGRREMAEELTHDTFILAIQKIGFFKSTADGNLKTWIFRMATHLTLDHLRREKRVELSNDFENIEEPSNACSRNPHDELERSQFNKIFYKALQQLTTAQRMFFLLYEQEEMSCLEISRVCGCSENAVKQGLFRARAALRRHLCDST